MALRGPSRARTTRALRRSARRARFRLRNLIGQYPTLYLPIARRKRSRHLRDARKRGVQPEWIAPVERDTDAVIEGFPRSANTFAATAFELVQPNPVKVARHLHVPAQIIGGARFGIPTMVLVRNPEEAVLSLVVRTPSITIEQGLRDYVRFYRRILPYRADFVIARFDEVSTDFGLVIRRLNERFGTAFREFDHTEENVARCFAIIEQHSRTKGGAVAEAKVGRPSIQRETMKNALRKAIRSRDFASVRAEAHDVSEMLSS